MYRTSINAKPQDDTLPFESQLGVFRNSKDAQSQTLLSFSAMKSGKKVIPIAGSFKIATQLFNQKV